MELAPKVSWVSLECSLEVLLVPMELLLDVLQGLIAFSLEVLGLFVKPSTLAGKALSNVVGLLLCLEVQFCWLAW